MLLLCFELLDFDLDLEMPSDVCLERDLSFFSFLLLPDLSLDDEEVDFSFAIVLDA